MIRGRDCVAAEFFSILWGSGAVEIVVVNVVFVDNFGGGVVMLCVFLFLLVLELRN